MIVGRRILGCKALNSNMSNSLAMMPPLRRTLSTDVSAFSSFPERCAVAYGYLDSLSSCENIEYTRKVLVEARNLSLVYEKSEGENAKLKDALAKSEQTQTGADVAIKDNADLKQQLDRVSNALTEAEWQNLVAKSKVKKRYTLKSILELYIKALYGRDTEYGAGLARVSSTSASARTARRASCV